MTANEVFKQVLKMIQKACNGLPDVLKLSIQCNVVHVIKNVFVVSFYVTDAMHWLETPTSGLAGKLPCAHSDDDAEYILILQEEGNPMSCPFDSRDSTAVP
jgi:hypothetical protein